jgi:hypothetical protein
MNTTTAYTLPARRLICALAACVLTVVFLGEISQASVQAAQHALRLQT